MVNRGYFGDEEPSSRRYNSRGTGYSSSHDRELSTAPLGGSYDRRREHRVPSHEDRNPDSSTEPDLSSRPRSRIPVACGRCRKRKIRCSGDNGGPCSNCKSAGNEQCQFLRVSSTEAPMKGDEFNYDATTALSRSHCRMVPYGPQFYTQPTNPIGSDNYQFRSNSVSNYQYPIKSYYGGMPSFTEFADENPEYGLQASPYPLMSPDHTTLSTNPNYGASGPGRDWIPASQMPKSTSLFLDHDSIFNSSPIQFHVPVRPALGPESKGISIGTIGTPLHASMSGADRILPYPANNRPVQFGPFPRNGESAMSSSHTGYQPYSNLLGTPMLSGVRYSNGSVASDNPSFLSMPSTSPESISSSQGSYSTISPAGPMTPQTSDMYNSPSQDGLYHPVDSSDSSYTPRRRLKSEVSESSQTSNGEAALPPASDGPGTLANGHSYIPYNNHPGYHPAPPLDMDHLLPASRRISAVHAS